MVLVIEFAHNIALLFGLTFVYSLIIPRINSLPPIIKSVVQGILFGLFGIFAMVSAIPVGNGFIIDGRLVIVAIAGIFTGGISTFITTLIIIGYRLTLGGVGLWSAIPSIGVAALTSFFLFRQQTHFTAELLIRRLVLIGIINTLQTLFCIGILGGEQGSEILKEVALPLLVFTPMGTVLLGFLLFYQQQQFEVAAALRTSEERYRVVVTSLNEGIIVRNSNGEVITSNAAAEKILGLTTDQLAGWTLTNQTTQIIHENGLPFSSDNYPSMTALRTGVFQSNIVMGIRKPDETVTWANVNSQPLFAKDSRLPYATLSTYTDITDIRKAHEKLRQERDLLRTLIDNTPDYIFLKDAEGRFILTNKAHAYAAGNIHPDDLIGKTAFDVFKPELATQFHEDDQKIMQSGNPLINAERETVDAQGNQKIVLTTKIPWRDKQGHLLGLVGISRDVTERKQLESQSIVLGAEQERLRVLQHFIRDMSHDFRTPLSIINSSTYLLRKLMDPEKREAKINSIERQSERLLKLLDDMLEMGRLDDNSVVFQFTEEIINPIVRTIVNDFQSTAAIKHQTLDFTPDPTLPSTYIDVAKFSRAVISLVQNAIHYTLSGGKITLHTAVEADQIILSVADNGIGIAEADLPHIFERFYRVDDARGTTTGGSGLGLSITKKIIEAHHGSILVKSIPGEGSTFVIKLPIDMNSAPKTA